MNARCKLRFLVTCLLLAAPVMVLAQEPPPPPPDHRGAADPAAFADHRVKFMTRLLSLTDDQQKQATTIFTDAASASSKLQAQFKTAHENLRTAVKNKNAAAVDQGAAAIGNLTAQMIAIREKSEIAFAKILTSEQQTKLDKFDAERPPEHMGPMPSHQRWQHRRGMPPPPQGPDAPNAPVPPPDSQDPGGEV